MLLLDGLLLLGVGAILITNLAIIQKLEDEEGEEDE